MTVVRATQTVSACRACCFALAAVLPLPALAQSDLGTEENAASGAPRAARAWSLRLTGELGVSTSDVDLPVDGIVQRIRPGLAAAFGLGFELDHVPSERVTLGLLARYQSSLANAMSERHTDGSEHPLDVRSHRVELAFVPEIRLDARGTWALGAAAGYAFRNFRPEVHHLVTPAYSLSGPFLRARLGLSLWDGTLRLGIGPELHWIAVVGQDLVARGMAGHGLAAGGELAAEVALGERWSLRAAYHELRAFLDSAQAQPFEDVTRFATAGVVGEL